MSIETFWTSWKLETGERFPVVLLVYNAYYKLDKIVIEFIAPYANATSAQMLANGRFFQSELGTSADCPSRSRCRIQRGNAASSTTLTASSEAVAADRILDKSSLIILW
jgi:hypothetical protein